ncbi:winged helix-turn-helix transcriptional regulator [Microbacterium sp. ZW CA_36]|uniref:winged helix-turn-helix transcriptional regulator n=1 Tax=Microbacterium sp. ZW CA_36 TaxID=3378078 RepID=UPI0038540FB7
MTMNSAEPAVVELPPPCAESTHELVRDMITRVADKWTMLVIATLAEGPVRFTALLDAIPGISHRMLTRTLRSLQRDGMVLRTAYAEVPPRVEYTLTALGATLIGPVVAFVDWAERHQEQVRAHRDQFDHVAQ